MGWVMNRKMTALLASAALLAVSAGAANAATYVSKLEYKDGAVGAQVPSYGTVTITELNANNVRVEVALTSAASLFVNTGGPHDPFLFNLNGDWDVTVDNSLSPGQQFSDDGYTNPGANEATPFGFFTNKIGCCGGEKNKGAANGDPDILRFNVFNASGITFAGVGAVIDAGTGRVITPGTGADAHFLSNAGKWWFTADIFDAASGLTYNVAAKDAFGPTCTGDCGGGGQGSVPEPATWAMMIMGFGGVGALMRRRRTVFG